MRGFPNLPKVQYYYFLEDIDIEGNTERSEVISIPSKPQLTLQEALPTRFTLYQNYPNPFNPETWLPYDLAADAPVELAIYAPDGGVVRRLNFGVQPAGSYLTKEKAAYWDGRNEKGELVSSGTYFYHLKAGDFQATRKMFILK